MNTAIMYLLGAAIVLFLLSFLLKDKSKELEKDMEELSMKFLQENYQLKKRLKVLEEELLLEPEIQSQEPLPAEEPVGRVNEILKNHVLALYGQGLDLAAISKQSSLPIEDIRHILRKK